MNVLIIPTHERPEMLWCCVDKLAECEGIDQIEVRIHCDTHVEWPKSARLETDIARTIQHAKQILPQVKFFETIHNQHGSSFNVLSAFKSACESDAKYVHFLEDDCWVTSDWFRFCEAAHEMFHPFAVVGNPPPKVRDANGGYWNPAAVYLSDTWLQTFAMSFDRERLKEMLLPEYHDYKLLKTFEWDAYMLQYVLEKQGIFMAMPHLPRVYHYGFYSYHLGGTPRVGTLEERVEFVKAAAKDVSLLPKTYHFIPFPTRSIAWTELHRDGASIRPQIK